MQRAYAEMVTEDTRDGGGMAGRGGKDLYLHFIERLFELKGMEGVKIFKRRSK